MNATLYTLGLMAVELGVQAHHLRRLAKRGKIPFRKSGRLHLVSGDDIPQIVAALREAGYLRTEEVAAK